MNKNDYLSRSERRLLKWNNFPSFLVKQSRYHLTPADWKSGWKVQKVIKLKLLSFWFPRLDFLYEPTRFAYLCNNTVELLAISIGGFIEPRPHTVPLWAAFWKPQDVLAGPSKGTKEKSHIWKKIQLTQINVERIAPCTRGREAVCAALWEDWTPLTLPFRLSVFPAGVLQAALLVQQESCACLTSPEINSCCDTSRPSFAFTWDVKKQKLIFCCKILI